MARLPSVLDNMDDEEKKQLKNRLWTFQSNVCFLCAQSINLDADETEIDHIKPLHDKGPDEEANWALMHAHCNKKKKVANLELARAMMRFELLKEKYQGSITSGDVLREFGGSTREIFLEDKVNSVLVRYEYQGRNVQTEMPIMHDPNNPVYRTFFISLPIDFIYHDAELNPRKIIDIDKLLTEFWRKNPQLHVALGRVRIDGNQGKSKVLLFDGQHKTAAQIILGNKNVMIRVFLNPDKDNLKETNRRAHKELRQIEFFRSVLDSLGQDIFSVHYTKYLEDLNTSPKSEKGYIESVEAEQRNEERKNLYHFLRTMVRDSDEPKNKLFNYVEMEAPRSKTWPLSYDSIEKTFFKHFLDPNPCEVPVDTYDENPDDFPRMVERKNLVTLMNIFAEETLEGKFDKNIGVFKIENRIRKGENIPQNHIRAYRMYRPAAFQVWCELLKEALSMYLLARGKLTQDFKKRNRILWVQMDEENWQDIRRMVRKLASHKIWIDTGDVISNAFGQTRPEFFRKLLEQGQIDVRKILDQPINVQFIFSAVGK
jgi:hypothetical protein